MVENTAVTSELFAVMSKYQNAPSLSGQWPLTDHHTLIIHKRS